MKKSAIATIVLAIAICGVAVSCPIDRRSSDVNWDGTTNVLDLLAVLVAYGTVVPSEPRLCPTTPPTWRDCPTEEVLEDVNVDNVVDREDIFLVLDNWGGR